MAGLPAFSGSVLEVPKRNHRYSHNTRGFSHIHIYIHTYSTCTLTHTRAHIQSHKLCCLPCKYRSTSSCLFINSTYSFCILFRGVNLPAWYLVALPPPLPPLPQASTLDHSSAPTPPPPLAHPVAGMSVPHARRISYAGLPTSRDLVDLCATPGTCCHNRILPH